MREKGIGEQRRRERDDRKTKCQREENKRESETD